LLTEGYDTKKRAEPIFVNLNFVRSPRIDSQPGGIDSWTPEKVYKHGLRSNAVQIYYFIFIQHGAADKHFCNTVDESWKITSKNILVY
jgi:hypothetical protein